MKENLYRSRLKIPLNEKVLNFISCIFEDLWILDEDIVGTEVHNIMLYEQGILTKNEIKMILKSLENLRQEFRKKKIKLSGNFEDIHPLIENKIIEDIGEKIGGKIHTGRSRNDQIVLDLRLKIRSLLNDLTFKILELMRVLLNLSKKYLDIYFPLYTHLQKAQLGTFSHYLTYYASQLLRTLERISECYKRINKCPLGACAIGGTTFNLNRERVAELLGFNSIIVNSIDAISSRDFILEPIVLLSNLAIQISRMAEDLILWSSEEFNFIDLNEQICSVSSIMPQKKNPDALELIRSRCSKIISNYQASALIIKNLPTGYFRDFQDLKSILKESFDLTFNIIEILKIALLTLKLKKNNLKRSIENSFILAPDIAEHLSNEYDIPFRIAHKIIASLILNENDPKCLRDLKKIKNVMAKHLKFQLNLSNDFLKDFQNLNTVLKNRRTKGSPVRREIVRYINELNSKRGKYLLDVLDRLIYIKKGTKLRKDIINSLSS